MTFPCRNYLAVFVALSALGCGDDDDSGSSFQSGIDDQNTVSDLGADDKRQFCSSLDAHVKVTVGFEQLARLACLPLAVFSGDSTASCERLLDDCMKTAPEPLQLEARFGDEQVCFESLNACQAQVGALEGCINVNIDTAVDLLERLSCARFGDEAVRRDAQRAMDTARSCGEVSASCADFVTLL